LKLIFFLLRASSENPGSEIASVANDAREHDRAMEQAAAWNWIANNIGGRDEN
jgi:hypothetical protein